MLLQPLEPLILNVVTKVTYLADARHFIDMTSSDTIRDVKGHSTTVSMWVSKT